MTIDYWPIDPISDRDQADLYELARPNPRLYAAVRRLYELASKQINAEADAIAALSAPASGGVTSAGVVDNVAHLVPAEIAADTMRSAQLLKESRRAAEAASEASNAAAPIAWLGEEWQKRLRDARRNGEATVTVVLALSASASRQPLYAAPTQPSAGVVSPAAPVDAWVPLTDEDRDRAFNTLPDMLDGFLKKWGWLHFAKAIEDICREKNARHAAAELVSPAGAQGSDAARNDHIRAVPGGAAFLRVASQESARDAASRDSVRDELWRLVRRHELDEYPGFVDGAINQFLAALSKADSAQGSGDAAAPQAVRMLTEGEIAGAFTGYPTRIGVPFASMVDIARLVQRKFCEVNGIAAPQAEAGGEQL